MFSEKRTLDILEKLLNIASPTGYTKNAIAYVESLIHELGYETSLTPKGNLMVSVEGKDRMITRGISGHVDTLGLMVRSINANGTLALTTLGGPLTPTLDGEYCDVIARSGKVYRGTVLSTSPSVHVFKDANTKARDIDNLVVRLDEVVSSKSDVEALGIMNGDMVAYDPKVEITDSGFVKSRFLDDKASVAVMISVLETLVTQKIVPSTNLTFIFTTYEEVGHGASWLPVDITELLAVDMGCIGLDLACTEFDVSICAKDSSGPYDYEMVSQLVEFSKEKNLGYAVDIYPMYGSDASAALRGGNNIKAALIGPGVSSSHGMERTHIKALRNTFELILSYIQG